MSITAQTPGAGTPDERELAYRALVRATRGLQNRNTWIEHQMREQSNARITAWYNRPDRPSEDFDDPEDTL